jgi:hypothetical protein
VPLARLDVVPKGRAFPRRMPARRQRSDKPVPSDASARAALLQGAQTPAACWHDSPSNVGSAPQSALV